ncbi:MAG: exodeoxyribonuclease VII large subunit [Pseudomonadota bacterium]
MKRQLEKHILEKNILSVSQLNTQCKNTLETTFPLIWVEGEISNYIHAASGHWYFTLKDSKSQIRCAMFKFKNSTIKFKPENGMQVTLRAKITIYEPRGDYQLICEHMELAGDGQLLREFELLKQKLTKQGLFNDLHKQTLPEFPKTVGIISSPDGAAVHDILHVLKRRSPSVKVILYSSQVQGKNAPEQLRKALSLAQQQAVCDVLIIGRGGGSLEDLNAFNDEHLANDIYSCNIPIVSAVGHEIDFSICDFVADIRAATPSSAAEIVSQDEQLWLKWLDQTQLKLLQLIKNTLDNKKKELQWLRKQLKHPTSRLDTYKQKLDELAFRQNQAIISIITKNKHYLELQKIKLGQYQPELKIKQNQDKLHNINHRLYQAMTYTLKHKQEKLQTCIQKLDVLSPLSIMSRGYALITNQETNQLVKSKSEVKTDDIVKIRFANNYLFARILDS